MTELALIRAPIVFAGSRREVLKATDSLRFSASRAQTYMTCPLQARFQYLDKLPRPKNSSAVYGICVHRALQHYNNTGDLDASVKLFCSVWDKPEQIDEHIDTWTKGTNAGSMRERGIKTLHAYHEQKRWEKRTVIATEHKFVVPFGKYELGGFVDLVELVKNKKGDPEIHIVDYKTNKRKPAIMNLRWNVQFTVYSFAALQPEFWKGTSESPGIKNGEDYWRMTQTIPVRPIWYQLELAQTIDAGIRNDEDFLRLHRVCDEMRKAMELDVYMPNISGESCTYCPYKTPCGLPLHLDEEEDAL